MRRNLAAAKEVGWRTVLVGLTDRDTGAEKAGEGLGSSSTLQSRTMPGGRGSGQPGRAAAAQGKGGKGQGGGIGGKWKGGKGK